MISKTIAFFCMNNAMVLEIRISYTHKWNHTNEISYKWNHTKGTLLHNFFSLYMMVLRFIFVVCISNLFLSIDKYLVFLIYYN